MEVFAILQICRNILRTEKKFQWLLSLTVCKYVKDERTIFPADNTIPYYRLIQIHIFLLFLDYLKVNLSPEFHKVLREVNRNII